MNKVSRLFTLVTIVALFLAAIGIVSAQDPVVLNLNWGEGDVPFLDPSHSTDASSIQIITEIFPGLTRINELTLEVEPSMASSWDISEDGMTYTFHIIPEVAWVSYNLETGEVTAATDDAGNTRYVTANDFKYGMLRSMDPRVGEYYGGILSGWIQGGTELYSALDGMAEDAPEADVTAAVDAAVANVQINVVDDYTLEITSPKPAAFVSNIYGMWMSTAQPSWLVEEYGETWTEPDVIQTYGPFALAAWEHGAQLDLAKNPLWVGTETIPAPSIDLISGVMIDLDAGLANYEAGTLDNSGVPRAQVDRVRTDPVLGQEFSIEASSCTFYLGFNTTIAPTDDVRIRQALGLAVDRQAIIDSIFKDGRLPAFFFTRPDLVAAPHQEDYPDDVLGYDPERATALVDEVKAEKGELAEITFLITSGSSTGPLVAEAMQQMWSAVGLDNVVIQEQEFAVFLETTKSPTTNPPIHSLGWCLDYPDTNNFLYDVFDSANKSNWGFGWTNDEFDALVEQAQVEPDTATRTDLYAQAENILVNQDAVIAPLYYGVAVQLTKPYVERPQGRLANTYYEFWKVNR